jgi:hypothetical protein
MKNDRTSRILSRLEKGLLTDSARLKQLDQDFTLTLRGARNLGLEQKFPHEWDTTWNEQWSIVEALLVKIRGLLNTMDVAIESSDDGRLKEALDAWDMIQSEDDQLVKSLGEIRLQANVLNDGSRIEWNLLATTFDANLETIHACSQAMRVKLELLMEHTKEEVDLLILGVLEKLPKLTQQGELDTEMHQWKIDAAAIELAKEQHQSGGFLDVIKALFMWVETPEERLENDRSLRID